MNQLLDDMRKAVRVADAHLRVVAHDNYASPDALHNAAHALVSANQNLTLARASFYERSPSPAASKPVDPTHDGGPKTPTLARLGHALAVEDGCDPNCLVETKFTKGLQAWAMERGPGYARVRILDSRHAGVGEARLPMELDLEHGEAEIRANGTLWAAAPELFAACQAAYVRLLSLGQYRGRVSTAGQRELSDLRNALAKAVDVLHVVEIQDSAEALAANMKAAEAGIAPSREEQDTHLLDAAPDMYAAGRAVVASWEKGDLAGAVRALAAALVKADGGTP